MIRYGIDLSNYSGVPSHQDLVYLREHGIEWAILGTQVDSFGNNYTIQQAEACGAALIHVIGVYEVVYFDEDDDWRFHHAKSFGLPVWVDCEVDVGGLSPSQVVQHLQYVVSLLGNQYAGIYTGRWWWEPFTGNSTAFAYSPLWIADWRQSFSFDSFVPMGGWTRPVLWQYANHGLNSINCDLNAWEYVPAQGNPTPPLPDPGVIVYPWPGGGGGGNGGGGGYGGDNSSIILIALAFTFAAYAVSKAGVYKKVIVKGNTGPVTVSKHKA